jgi:hypothetical protein
VPKVHAAWNGSSRLRRNFCNFTQNHHHSAPLIVTDSEQLRLHRQRGPSHHNDERTDSRRTTSSTMAQTYFPNKPVVAPPQSVSTPATTEKHVKTEDVQEAFVENKNRYVRCHPHAKLYLSCRLVCFTPWTLRQVSLPRFNSTTRRTGSSDILTSASSQQQSHQKDLVQ